MKVRLNRNDPVNDPWWSKQESMTRSMARKSRPPTAPGAAEGSEGPGEPGQSTEADSSLDDLHLTSPSSSSPLSPLKPSLPDNNPAHSLPWDSPTPLGRALKKLALSSSRHDRDKDSVYTDAFRGGAMDADVFRKELKRSLGVRLTEGEFGEIRERFGGEGEGENTVDGEEVRWRGEMEGRDETDVLGFVRRFGG